MNKNVLKTTMILESLAIGLGVNPVKHPLLWPLIEANDIYRIVKRFDSDESDKIN